MRPGRVVASRDSRRRGRVTGICASLLTACSLSIDSDALRSELGKDPLTICPDEQKLCELEGEPSCVSIDDPEFGCARERCAPCIVAHATASCDRASGECFIGACIGSWANCDHEEQNGCESNLDHDESHCRECDFSCPAVPNAAVACGGAHCYILNCEPVLTRADCNGEYDDGCEVDLSNNAAHCGECEQACDGGERCIDGRCRAK